MEQYQMVIPAGTRILVMRAGQEEMSAFAMAEDDAEANNLAASTHGLNQGVLPTTWAYADDIWTQNYVIIRRLIHLWKKLMRSPVMRH
ncbi:MAG: hypothetical protein WDN26_05080 [Chitinophagaceae bacterium]